MTKSSNIPAIEKATGITWEDWLEYLESADAKNLTHKAIAQLVYEKLKEHESGGWWSQGVAVAYEQHIGRREPGQQNDGSYEVSVSKTVGGTMSEALEKWIQLTSNHTELNGVGLEIAPTWSETDKWRNWRVSLADGSRVVVGIYQKTPDKATVGLAHTKLTSSDDAEKWRLFWKTFLGGLSI